ncbi:MAG TPA: hypothetical protein VK537_01675, partial [Galbitalea sp.]|nr:hypothetical protein [Galbitalea sp.]
MSTDTSARAVVRYLGGESGHRSFFGGTHSRARVILLVLFVVAGMILTPLVGWVGLAVAVAGVGVTLVVTARTYRGSILDRRRKRSRWIARLRSGTVRFTPYEVARWDQLTKGQVDASHARGVAGRDARAEFAQHIVAMRAHPDGADGMGWLRHGRGQAGIAWHAPIGEQPYLSVTFAVTGQLRGIESTAVMSRAAEGWGAFLSS